MDLGFRIERRVGGYGNKGVLAMDDLNLRTSDGWTPLRGVLRGLMWGWVAAVILAIPANILAWYAPGFATNLWVRNGAVVVTMWLLFGVVHGAAGMAGWACTAIVIVLTLLVAGSQHVAFALHGGPFKLGTADGWEWCSLPALVGVNVWVLPGIALAAWMWREGASFGAARDILRMRVWGSFR